MLICLACETNTPGHCHSRAESTSRPHLRVTDQLIIYLFTYLEMTYVAWVVLELIMSNS